MSGTLATKNGKGSRTSQPRAADRRRSAPATIRDVARAAGVSVATVSRVFNGTARVRRETDRDVRRAASRLEYWPNASARSLITSRSHTLGVLLPDLHGEFYSEVIRGTDLAARKAGYHLLVSSSHASSAELLAALRSMHGRIDGLVVMAPDPSAVTIARECSKSIPAVVLNPGGEARACSTISIASHEGARQGTRHLVELGHERIATVTGPSRNTDARNRLAGYRAALREAGIKPPVKYEVQGAFTETSGYEAGGVLLRLRPRPTAVFVANDHMAVGVIGALHDAGVRLPEDMAIVGFDDIDMARYINPPLTTVHADTFRLGQRAVERLMELIVNPGDQAPRHEVLPATLVIRGSCGATSHRGVQRRRPGRKGKHTLRHRIRGTRERRLQT